VIPPLLVQSTARFYRVRPKIFRALGHAITHERGWTLVAQAIEGWIGSSVMGRPPDPESYEIEDPARLVGSTMKLPDDI